MKKLFILISGICVLSACSSTDPYTKRADLDRERQEKAVDRAIDRAPKWMSKLPESKDAVYANGTAISRDFAMADIKAKNIAYSSICMAAGGEVDKSSKMYLNDTESASTENSELAVRSMCRRVDITGAEVVETVRVSENGRFRTYVLIALPTGDANRLQKRKDQLRASENSRSQSERAYRELDAR